TDRTAEPATVLATANTTGTIWARWAWVDAAVWTERMLTALENGVQGSKWYSLMDKVGCRKTLERAWIQVQANKGVAGVDHVRIEEFEQHLDENLDKLVEGLREGPTNHRASAELGLTRWAARKNAPWE